jgi:hypothetical protein
LAKLILHEARETEKETDRLRHLAEEEWRKEIDLIVDFLQQLYNYILRDDGYFKEHHASWLVDSDIDFVLVYQRRGLNLNSKRWLKLRRAWDLLQPPVVQNQKLWPHHTSLNTRPQLK